MAVNAARTPWIKSDEIRFDTSRAPWMDIARAELNKKVRERPANDPLLDAMRTSLAVATLERRLAEQKEAMSSRLLKTTTSLRVPDTLRLLKPELRDPGRAALGSMTARRLKETNPEIDKYFTGLKTDPSLNAKGRSFQIDSTYAADDSAEVTAWCAAFVNWCLRTSGAPHLGYATAKSWLDFGTPVAHPVFGCITIIKPSSATRSTTGHVAFFVEPQGKKVKLLGGNQDHGTRVSESLFDASTVLGYRWPTRINYYLLAETGVVT